MSLTLPRLRSRRRRDAVLAPWNVKAPPAHGIATATKGMRKYIAGPPLRQSRLGRKKKMSPCSVFLITTFPHQYSAAGALFTTISHCDFRSPAYL